MRYGHSSIWINGRDVSLVAILNESEKGQDDFEDDTFTFIRDWLSEKDSFEMMELNAESNSGVPGT